MTRTTERGVETVNLSPSQSESADLVKKKPWTMPCHAMPCQLHGLLLCSPGTPLWDLCVFLNAIKIGVPDPFPGASPLRPGHQDQVHCLQLIVKLFVSFLLVKLIFTVTVGNQ